MQGIPVIPPEDIRSAVIGYVKEMNSEKAFNIGLDIFKKGQERIFGSGTFKYDVRGIFQSKQECYLQNHWTVPFFPPEDNIKQDGGIDGYFAKDRGSAISFCTFKYMLGAESLLNHIQEGKLHTDVAVKEKAAIRELPEAIADSVITYAKERGFLQPKSHLNLDLKTTIEQSHL
jgi:hypothetical protein